jgi:hypothetical protein
VTGAQASLYKRAKTALEQALPLLEGLTPLRSDSDDQDVEAIRAIIESNWTELVNEFGYVGGPRVQVVETLFESLLGIGFAVADPEVVQGQLGELRDRLGLDRARVNTIEEEQNLTNFLILADYTTSLYESWQAQARFLSRSGVNEVFLGTQVTLINRALAALGESVREARYVLDSVFINEAERETIFLDFGAGEPSLTIAELLQWTEHVALEEGPRLLREGGKDGALALVPKLETLTQLLKGGFAIAQKASFNPVQGFHTPRVRRALQEIVTHSEQTLALTRQLQPSPLCYELGVQVEGNGSVTSTDGKIDCGETCSTSYPIGTVVGLQAKPVEYVSQFDHWEVDGCEYNLGWEAPNQLLIAIAKPLTVKAVFKDVGSGPVDVAPPEERDDHTLELRVEGNGTVTVSGDGTTNTYSRRHKQEYLHGTMLTLEAKPAADFRYWEIGGQSNKNASISFEMEETLTVTAHFEPTVGQPTSPAGPQSVPAAPSTPAAPSALATPSAGAPSGGPAAPATAPSSVSGSAAVTAAPWVEEFKDITGIGSARGKLMWEANPPIQSLRQLASSSVQTLRQIIVDPKVTDGDLQSWIDQAGRIIQRGGNP